MKKDFLEIDKPAILPDSSIMISSAARPIALLLAAGIIMPALAAQSNNVTIQVSINKLTVQGGDVYIAVFESAEAYKQERAFRSVILPALATTLVWDITLPPGDYLVSAFQDTNNNQKLDKNLLGIPREPIGLSNYNGKGIPGGFNALKTAIHHNGQILAIDMVRF